GISAALATKYTIGAEMNQSRINLFTQQSQPMRKRRIDFQARQHFLRRSSLLDHAHRINHCLGTKILQHLANRTQMSDVNVRISIPFIKQVEATVRRQGAAQSDAHVMPRSPTVEQLVTEHSISANDQAAHCKFPVASYMMDSNRSNNSSRSKCCSK